MQDYKAVPLIDQNRMMASDFFGTVCRRVVSICLLPIQRICRRTKKRRRRTKIDLWICASISVRQAVVTVPVGPDET